MSRAEAHARADKSKWQRAPYDTLSGHARTKAARTAIPDTAFKHSRGRPTAGSPFTNTAMVDRAKETLETAAT
eukprot:CAMPEP_0171240890 /NCGR_PEP_ID=MMETSP0790-20130122/44784_1 /TAXON_ID=2925 /ORGANISM="Alexandrium catenella, Strain OF101" /LENGTH=72 /DNA_ID=CAMNT_0011707425 /DNA_START=31 /DNA_END=245 /DNA_ORIENTATION=+